jgi:hypothetical protein
MTKADLIHTLTDELRKFGFPSVTETMVGEIFEVWCDGARGLNLPHGLIGMFAGRQLDDVEAKELGLLAGLK